MRVLFHATDLALAIFTWILVAAAVLYWLIGFKQVDASRRAVAVVGACLAFVTEPVLRPLRRLLPELGGVDISPLVAIMMVATVRYVIALYIVPKLL